MPDPMEPITEEERAALRGGFLQLISAHSEDYYCAGWMSGIEKEIRARGGLWIMLAAACGGWPLGYQAEHGWSPLTSEEWAWVAHMAGASCLPDAQRAGARAALREAVTPPGVLGGGRDH